MSKVDISFIEWRSLNMQELISNFINFHEVEFKEFTEREFQAYERVINYNFNK